jgi:hypothetical protein
MQLNITIQGEELESQQAAKQLRLLARMVKEGVVHSEGFNIEYMGDWSLDVDFGSEFPHGDYQDAEGNLLHVANDTVVSVNWASKGGESEVVEISVVDWVAKHGEIQPAGSGEGRHDH